MKKYSALGDLLVDYRNLNGLSQFNLAAMLDVDHRTVLRWEKDETLIQSEKEKELVEKTFIPYQVIRNLNATVPIPVFFDFRIRKYSLSELSIGLPDAQTIKTHLKAVSPRVKSIAPDEESNIDLILRYHDYVLKTEKQVSRELIVEASKILPELNLIMHDHAGYYAGHCVVFPVRDSVYTKLREREIVEGELEVGDFVNFRLEETPVFYGYSVYADCNENFHYMLNALLNFVKDQNKYIFSAFIIRPDAIPLMMSFGLKKIWEENNVHPDDELNFFPAFLEGTLENLSDK